ncbi:diphthine--ammonia ligase [Anopheles stephensi]|uniref:diphthine--ammonia ligase n=1 Tax=Anopheles stephensi TaxID=30069 RepID=UPI0016587D54|nr:diphthine--ammonia ligase [Anopheles stephensi]
MATGARGDRKMRVVALVSGGKDSTYNMMQVVAEGHELVALANLHPKDRDELDSYMYQTVGHQGIEKLAQAMELPLYRRMTRGHSINTKGHYEPTEDDEVEDLYELLGEVQREQQIEAVAVGAILSDYQRVRVENVCTRLNLISLAYLWRRDQTELLQEMIDCQVHAIIIKVAALGLMPDRHLGKSLKEMQPHLLLMRDKYGLNVCGEGGEYETFTLDCPLFRSRIVVDDVQTVISSADPVCPVGYLNFTKLRLVPKERIEPVVIKNSLDFIHDLNESSYSDLSDPDLSETELELIERSSSGMVTGGIGVSRGSVMRNSFSKDDLSGTAGATAVVLSRSNSITKELTICANLEPAPFSKSPVRIITKARSSISAGECGPSVASSDGPIEVLPPFHYSRESRPLSNRPRAIVNSKGWMWVAGVQGCGEDSRQAMASALAILEDMVHSRSFTLKQICYITLYVRNMGEYSFINEIYSTVFAFANPPTRVCVECPLPADCAVVLEAVAFNPVSSASELEHKRQTMHVQGISHWAPANIGTYSQSTKVGHITYISGQIALVPGSMTIIEGGIKQQCKLTLRHLSRIAKAMNAQGGQLRDVVQGICFVTHPSYIYEARRQWERRTANAIIDYIVVPSLPRGALVEWQVWAHSHNDKFDYEETGCSIGEYSISIRRRWNYENNCASIVCYVSTGLATSTTKLTELTDDYLHHHTQLAQRITREHIHDTIAYVLRKLLQAYPGLLGISPSSPSAAAAAAASNDESVGGAEDDQHARPHPARAAQPPSADLAKPAVHLRLFYQVDAIPSVQFLIDAVESFLVSPANVARIAYTVIPACHLQNFSTFISICGLRHHE